MCDINYDSDVMSAAQALMGRQVIFNPKEDLIKFPDHCAGRVGTVRNVLPWRGFEGNVAIRVEFPATDGFKAGIRRADFSELTAI